MLEGGMGLQTDLKKIQFFSPPRKQAQLTVLLLTLRISGRCFQMLLFFFLKLINLKSENTYQQQETQKQPCVSTLPRLTYPSGASGNKISRCQYS